MQYPEPVVDITFWYKTDEGENQSMCEIKSSGRVCLQVPKGKGKYGATIENLTEEGFSAQIRVDDRQLEGRVVPSDETVEFPGIKFEKKEGVVEVILKGRGGIIQIFYNLKQ